MGKVAFGVEYCGTNYNGWQRQSNNPTIQEHIENALSIVANHPVKVHCAGRTDTGVHAVQQVIHAETEVERENHSWIFGANANLPHDICLVWAKKVTDDFHARYSATARTYLYLILNRVSRSGLMLKKATCEYRLLNVGLMRMASEDLLGQHDFTSYRAVACQARSPIREVRRIDIEVFKNLIRIEIEANAFLHHMVRNIVGVLMTIGMEKQPVSWAKHVLEARDRTLGGITAPPDGLYLLRVDYPQHFEIPAPDLSVIQYMS